MNWHRTIGLIYVLLGAIGSSAQPLSDGQPVSKVAIEMAIKNENYPEAQRIITDHLNFWREQNLPDSLYSYLYDYARCIRLNKNDETAGRKAQKLFDEITALDPDTAHWISATKDLSYVYYECNLLQERINADSLYLKLVKSYSRATPVQYSQAYYSLGFNEIDLGRPKAAISLFKKSIDVLDPDDEKSIDRLVNGYNALGATHWRTGELRRAETAFQTSLRHIKRMKNEYDILGSTSNCLGNLSLIYHDQGQLVTAREVLLEAMEARKKAIEIGEDPAQNDQHQIFLLSHYRNLASIYLSMRDYDRALNITQRLYASQKTLLHEGHPSRALTDESFGSIYLGMGQLDKALKHLEKYLSFCEGYYGEDSFHTAGAHRRIGDIYLEMKNHVAAIESFSHGIRISKSISLNEDNRDLPGLHLARASANEGAGRYTRAYRDYQSAIAQLHKSRTVYDAKLGEAQMTLAKFFLNRHKLDSAAQAIDRSLNTLQAYKKDLGKKGSSIIRNPILYLADAYYVKAKILYADSSKNNPDEVEHYLNMAIDNIRQGRLAHDNEDARLRLHASHRAVFDFALQFCFQRYRETDQASYLNKVLGINEENMALLLRQQLNLIGSVQFKGVPDSVIAEEKRLTRLYNQYAQAATTDRDSSSMLEIEGQYYALKTKIRNEYPDYYALHFQDHITSIDEVRKVLLGRDHTMIEYIRADSRLFALVISPGKAELVELETQGLEQLLERYTLFIAQMETEPFAQVSASLFRMLVKPIEQYISTENLIIVSNPELLKINFETLIRPSKNLKPAYLIYDYNISYLLSATTGVQFSKVKNQGKQGILAFAPGFSDNTKLIYRNQYVGRQTIDEHYLHCVQQPFAVSVANNVTHLMPGIAYTDDKATERRFKETAHEYSIIHFGTHTEINSASPMLSRLILAKDSPGSAAENDGYLHVYEIYNLSLQAELAVLTACETGLGQENQSRGIYSLSHGFAYAGCPSVLMSLWKIDEKTSSEIITNFYENLARGETKSAALRHAKLKFLKTAKDDLAAPYFWSGLVLLGNTSPIAMSSDSSTWWMASLLILVLFAVAIIWKYRKKQANTN